MVFRRERRWFKSIHRVTRRAFPTARPFGELAVVRIGLVTIDALREGDRLLEVSARVAAFATHGRVFSLQRILGFCVVKVFANRSQRDFLPALGAMAGLAALRETPVVRVVVAIRTLGKRNPRIARLGVRARHVALLALHLDVQSGQRILRLGVIKLADVDRLPIRVVVALNTIRAQASFMRILVARGAGLGHAQKAARQVLHLDRWTRCGSDVVGGMTLYTRYARMFALQQVPGELVIEGLRVPLDQWKILAVMFRVTLRALIARPLRDVVRGMESLPRRQTSGDFRVAVKTLQRGRAVELMTRRAVGRPIQRLVSPRKRPGRNLRTG